VSEAGRTSEEEAFEARRKLTEGVAWVYVPTRPSMASEGTGPRKVEFELRQLPDGTAALPVFNEQELLTQQLGEYQPRERIAVLELLIQVSAARVPVVVNPVVQENVDRWTAASLESWKNDNGGERP
jgi:hypothetical protein